MKKVTRNDINKENMVVLSYCQCQTVLNLFGDDYKVGYNLGVCGWNYDLYRINGIDVVTGYNVPYQNCSNKEIKNKLVALENTIRTEKDSFNTYKKYKERFLEIFK